MPPKKEGEKHYYGFDSSGLEKAAAVSSLFNFQLFCILIHTNLLIGSQVP